MEGEEGGGGGGEEEEEEEEEVISHSVPVSVTLSQSTVFSHPTNPSTV